MLETVVNEANLEQFQSILDTCWPQLSYGLITIVLLWVLRYCYQLLFVPKKLQCFTSDPMSKYLYNGHPSTIAAELRDRCREYDPKLFPGFTSGWYAAMPSQNLKKMEVKSVRFFDKELVVYRNEQGEAFIMDAYCPHLGVNMGVGGWVEDGCVRCPFHGWKFCGSDGQCKGISYSPNATPSQAKVRHYPTMELWDWVLFWNAETEDDSPTWLPPSDGIASNWRFQAQAEHYVRSFCEEISENGADLAHFEFVHGIGIPAGTDLAKMRVSKWGFLEHRWAANWTAGHLDTDKHIGYIEMTHELFAFGWPVPLTKLTVNGRQIGPGIVILELEGRFFEGAYLHFASSILPNLQMVIHEVHVPRYIPAIVAKALIKGLTGNLERDIMVWNYKKYLSHPILSKSEEDALILKHRRWFAQFYYPRKKQNMEW